MTTYYRVPAIQGRSSRRTQIVATATGLVAVASITVTLAVSGGGDTTSPPSAAPATAQPDRATLYQRGAEVQQPAGSSDGRRAAERFHHFR